LGLWSCTSEDLAGYLQSVYRRRRSESNVTQHMSAVSHFYRMKGLASPSHGEPVKMFMRGLKRASLEARVEVKRAKPMTREVLHRLNVYLEQPGRTLREWRTIWRINVMFVLMLRWDDLCRLQVII